MEPLDIINRRLADYYGNIDDKPNYRIVWSEYEYEMRHGTYTDYTTEGIYLRTVTEVRQVPKYKQYLKDRYILERLTVVPIINSSEILDKISYEPIWVFEDKHGNPLPPSWPAAYFIIWQLHDNVRTAGFTKYRDPESKQDEALELKEQRLRNYEEVLFGNETETADALRYREGIVVPRNYKEKSNVSNI